MIDDAPQDGDAALEAVRRAVRTKTNQSFKETFNSCLLICAVGRLIRARSQGNARSKRKIVSLATLAAGVGATIHYWHGLSALLGHLV